MKTPSTKDTIGCATEVKQPEIPNLPIYITIDKKLFTLNKDVWDSHSKLYCLYYERRK